jgi:serine protease Do
MKIILLLFTIFFVSLQSVHAQISPGSFLGVFLADLDESRARALKSSEVRGAVVGKVIKDSPAEKAGLLENDIIISFDNQPILSAINVYTFLSEALPGSSVLLRLIRNGSEQTVTVIVNERQNSNGNNEAQNQNQYSTIRRNPSLGIYGSTLTVQLAVFFGVPNKSGLLVNEIEPRSPAARNGLKAGDCLISINEQNVDSLVSLNQIYSEFSLKGTANGKPVQELVFKIIRDQKEMSITIKIEQFKD